MLAWLIMGRKMIIINIDALSGAGIPVYAEAGRNGGIHLMNDFVLDKAVLSEEEKQEILTALQSINSMNNIDNNQTLRKLSAIFNMSSENWLEVDFSRWGGKTQDNDKFELLKAAVIGHQAVSITYVSSYGTQSQRKIHPLKLLYKSKEWYIKAYCTYKQDFRIFKFNRITDLALLDEHFTPVDFPDLQDDPNGTYNRIIIKFSKEMAYRVYDEFEAENIGKQKDGSLIVSAEMPEDSWLIGYLLSFGTQAEVLEPAYLRKVLSNKARKIYEMNKP